MEDIPTEGACVAGEALSLREIQDLNRGRLFVRNLVEESGCLLADTIESALASSVQVYTVFMYTSKSSHFMLVKVIKENLSLGEYCGKYCSRKLQYVPSSLGEELHLLHRVFIMYDNDKKARLSLNEVSHLILLQKLWRN